jgi:hypothetical protein
VGQLAEILERFCGERGKGGRKCYNVWLRENQRVGEESVAGNQRIVSALWHLLPTIKSSLLTFYLYLLVCSNFKNNTIKNKIKKPYSFNSYHMVNVFLDLVCLSVEGKSIMSPNFMFTIKLYSQNIQPN